jgi:hypothetical protein
MRATRFGLKVKAQAGILGVFAQYSKFSRAAVSIRLFLPLLRHSELLFGRAIRSNPTNQQNWTGAVGATDVKDAIVSCAECRDAGSGGIPTSARMERGARAAIDWRAFMLITMNFAPSVGVTNTKKPELLRNDSFFCT